MKRTKSALMKWLARSLVRLVPMGEAAVDFTTEVLPTMSQEVYGWWTGQTTPEERREELEALAQADRLEVQSAIEAAIEDAAHEAGVSVDPAKREKVKQYLEQVPDAIRRSLRRPGDSRGLTVPPHLAPRNADQLAALLPQRPPAFKAGDRPIPGVDIELVSPLGAGGFGEVWRARKTHLGQDVALKFCLDPHASASLRNETSLLRRLMSGDAMHPGIVRLLGTYNDCTALEYEFVEGGDLVGVIKEWHADGKKPSPRLVIDTVRQIAEIVAFAHQLDPPLVHRDLKPANILVQRKKDDSLRFRLTDFGIGGIAAIQQVAATQRGASPSATTSLNGSYSFLYASPQQMRAERPDPTDDVYSLGVIFWQLANGDMSDGAPGGTSWMEDLKGEGYPAAVVTAIASCFDRRPDRRPKTAAVLVQALSATLPPPMPVKPSSGTNALGFAVRTENHSKAQVDSKADVVRTANPTNAEPTVSEKPKPPVAPPPQRHAKSSTLWWIVGGGVAALLLLTCIGGLMLTALVGQSTTNTISSESLSVAPDPRLQGWPTRSGDVFVTNTTSPEGTVVVVQNAGAHYVVHHDGRRVPVVWDDWSNMWQVAQ